MPRSREPDSHAGMYGIILSSKLIIPNWTDLVNGDEVEEDLAEEEEELPESPTWAPNTWKRAHWLYRMAASCIVAFASSVTRCRGSFLFGF